MKPTPLFIILIINIKALALASIASNNVWQIEDGVFAGSAIDQDSEKVYFGMELIQDEKDVLKWRRVKSDLQRMVYSQDRGLLVSLAIMQKRNTPPPFEKVADFFESEKEYNQLTENLRTLVANNKLDALRSSNPPGGVYSIGYYVVYAAKQPVTEKLRLADYENETKSYSAFARTYDFLIMMMSSWEMNASTFQNRGICKNPLSIIEDSHKGISMHLHSFSAAVWSQFFQKEKLYVAAMPSMSKILQRTLDFSEYLLNGVPPTKEAIFSGKIEQEHLIDVDGLISRFDSVFQGGKLVLE